MPCIFLNRLLGPQKTHWWAAGWRPLTYTINFASGMSRIWLWGGGVRLLPLVLRGQFLLNYNNFVHIENTISDHLTIFKEKSASSLNIYRISVDLIYISLTFNILLWGWQLCIISGTSTPVVPWLSYSPLDPRLTGSNPPVVDGFFRA